MANVLVQSLDKIHMKYVLQFRMIIFHDQKALSLNFKTSCSQIIFKIDVLKKLAMFTGKHMCWSYFWYSCRAGGLQLYWKEIKTPVLSCEYCKIFKNTYFEEHLRMAASVLLIIKLLIEYWTSADLFLIKNITWNGFYCEALKIWLEYTFCWLLVETIPTG